jgi:hypothetical protein
MGQPELEELELVLELLLDVQPLIVIVNGTVGPEPQHPVMPVGLPMGVIITVHVSHVVGVP